MLLKSIVLFPGTHHVNEVSDVGEQKVSVRVARRFDDFALALGRHTAAEIHVEDAAAMPEPIDDGIFICRPEVLELSLAKQPERVHFLSSRTVVVDLVRTRALRWAERYALAAVVPAEQYFFWQDNHKRPGAPAIVGLRSIGEKEGFLDPSDSPPDGQTYALLHHSGFSDLPAFLIAYLHSYVANL